jgi:carbon starvation protein
MTAGFEKLFSAAPNIGFLAHAAVLGAELAAPGLSAAHAAEISRLIWNDRIDALMTIVLIAVVATILLDSFRVWLVLIVQQRARMAAAGTEAAA